jgi:GAF domain-containing protein
VESLLLCSRTLALALERLAEKARHQAVNRLFQKLLQKPLEALYQEVLEEAVRQVPGAEAGSLLVLEEGVYRFRAAVGYDLEGLKGVAFRPEDQLLWYGLGEEEALRGEPRILSTTERPIAEISHETAPPEVMDRAGRATEIQANLCLPIPYQGQVLAYLNLDNLHDPGPLARTASRPPASSPPPWPPSSTRPGPGGFWRRPPSPIPSRAFPTAGPLNGSFWRS